jgi:hypothetical protein
MKRETDGSGRAPRRRAFALEAVSVAAVLTITAALALPFVSRIADRASVLGRVDALAAGAGQARVRARAPGGVLLALDRIEPELTSWGDVGGCGVSGGGGGGIRWIGRRSGGGGIEVELLNTGSTGQDLVSNSLTLKAAGDLPGIRSRLNVGLSLPYLVNSRATNVPGVDYTHELEGFGDLSFLVTRKFGLEGHTSATLTLGIPIAEYDRVDSVPGNDLPVPYDAQLGKGVVTVGLTAEQSLDQDWGPVIVGGGYNYGGGKNDVELGNRKGTSVSDALTAYCYVGYRTDLFVHSVGVNFSYSFEKDLDWGEPAEDPSGFLTTLQYGLEYSHIDFPIFLAVTASLSPDPEANTWAWALGVVTSF